MKRTFLNFLFVAAACHLSFLSQGEIAFAVTKQQPASPTITHTVKHVAVLLSNEFTEVNMTVARSIFDSIRETVRAEEPLFLSKGLQKIIVRPLIAQENFVELLGYNQKNQLIGSFLLREKFALNAPSIRHALSNMCWPRENIRKQTLGKLVLTQNDATDARAYLNGFPLKAVNRQGEKTFVLDVPVGADSDRNVLMITGPNRPVVGRVLGKSMLFKTHRWSIPASRLAHR